MTTLAQQPLSRDELKQLIEDDRILAYGMKDGLNPIIRHAERRREYEIRALAMQFYLDHGGWIKP